MTKQLYKGWAITFRKNVHMYCHELTASKDGKQFSVPCEDSAVSDGLVVMWLHELDLDETLRKNLLQGLVQWANSSGLKYRIYATRDNYETNEQGQ